MLMESLPKRQMLMKRRGRCNRRQRHFLGTFLNPGFESLLSDRHEAPCFILPLTSQVSLHLDARLYELDMAVVFKASHLSSEFKITQPFRL